MLSLIRHFLSSELGADPRGRTATVEVGVTVPCHERVTATITGAVTVTVAVTVTATGTVAVAVTVTVTLTVMS